MIKPKFCPLMKGGTNTFQCGQPVTRYAFENFCNNPNFGSCRRYAEKTKQLKSPIQWLQREAVEMSGKPIERQDKR